MIIARRWTKGIGYDILFSWTAVNGKIEFCQFIYTSLTICTQFTGDGDVSDWVVISIYLETWSVIYIVMEMITKVPVNS